jgi:hypothetical protein
MGVMVRERERVRVEDDGEGNEGGSGRDVGRLECLLDGKIDRLWRAEKEKKRQCTTFHAWTSLDCAKTVLAPLVRGQT